MTYDWKAYAKGSWLEAINAMRCQGLLSGKYEPRNQEERELVRQHARRTNE